MDNVDITCTDTSSTDSNFGMIGHYQTGAYIDPELLQGDELLPLLEAHFKNIANQLYKVCLDNKHTPGGIFIKEEYQLFDAVEVTNSVFKE